MTECLNYYFLNEHFLIIVLCFELINFNNKGHKKPIYLFYVASSESIFFLFPAI